MKHLLQRGTRRMQREVDDQQGDGETEHAVAEAFHPARAELPAPARCAVVSWHGRASFASSVAAACRARLSSGNRAARVQVAGPGAVSPHVSADG